MLDTVCASQNNPMLVRVPELVIEQLRPNFLKQFTA
jgi:hypothetical protein